MGLYIKRTPHELLSRCLFLFHCRSSCVEILGVRKAQIIYGRNVKLVRYLMVNFRGRLPIFFFSDVQTDSLYEWHRGRLFSGINLWGIVSCQFTRQRKFGHNLFLIEPQHTCVIRQLYTWGKWIWCNHSFIYLRHTLPHWPIYYPQA